MKAKSFVAHELISRHKHVLMFFIVAAVFISASFAADDFGLEGKIGVILKFLSSPWVKGVACIFLVAEAIGLLTAGRQEPGMFKKFIPWIAGTVIFMAAGTITSKFITSTDTTFTSALNITADSTTKSSEK